MAKFVRYKDKAGSEFTAVEGMYDDEPDVQALSKPAVDADGRPLPAKTKTVLPRATKKTTAPRKRAAAKKSTPPKPPSGEPKENS